MPHRIPKAIECCSSGDRCNQFLEPIYTERSTTLAPGLYMTNVCNWEVVQLVELKLSKSDRSFYQIYRSVLKYTLFFHMACHMQCFYIVLIVLCVPVHTAHTCMHACVHRYMHVHTRAHTHTPTHKCTQTHVWVHVRGKGKTKCCKQWVIDESDQDAQLSRRTDISAGSSSVGLLVAIT